MFSNNSGPPYQSRYLKEGAAGFLDKSSDFDRLAHAVRLACKRSGP